MPKLEPAAVLNAVWDTVVMLGNVALQVWWVTALVAGAGVLRLAVDVRARRRLARSGIDEIDAMDGRTFERFLSTLFTRLGYHVELTQYRGDYGADLVIEKGGSRIAVQAKRWNRRVGVGAVQEAVAAKGLYRCNVALVVTNSRFTHQAATLAKANDVRLWDRDVLVAKCIEAGDDAARIHAAEPRCATCGLEVSERVVAYCRAHPDRFGGQIYCYTHQRSTGASPLPQPES